MKKLIKHCKIESEENRKMLYAIAEKCPTSTNYAFDRGFYLGKSQAYDDVLKRFEK